MFSKPRTRQLPLTVDKPLPTCPARHMTPLSTFAGSACLAGQLQMAALTLPFCGLPNATPAEEQRQQGGFDNFSPVSVSIDRALVQ
jgi:hypothetical protein